MHLCIGRVACHPMGLRHHVLPGVLRAPGPGEQPYAVHAAQAAHVLDHGRKVGGSFFRAQMAFGPRPPAKAACIRRIDVEAGPGQDVHEAVAGLARHLQIETFAAGSRRTVRENDDGLLPGHARAFLPDVQAQAVVLDPVGLAFDRRGLRGQIFGSGGHVVVHGGLQSCAFCLILHPPL